MFEVSLLVSPARENTKHHSVVHQYLHQNTFNRVMLTKAFRHKSFERRKLFPEFEDSGFQSLSGGAVDAGT